MAFVMTTGDGFFQVQQDMEEVLRRMDQALRVGSARPVIILTRTDDRDIAMMVDHIVAVEADSMSRID